RKVPFSIRSASASLYSIPDSIEEASINLGVSPVKSFFKVVLPVMKPAILGAAILMWVTSLAEISATIVLYYGGMETMPIQMFRQIDAGYLARASAYGVILMFVIIVPVYLAVRFLKLDLFSSRYLCDATHMSQRTFLKTGAATVFAPAAMTFGAAAFAAEAVVYTSNNVQVIDVALDIAKEQARDLTVQRVTSGTGALMKRIEAEAAKPLGDVVWGAGFGTMAARSDERR